MAQVRIRNERLSKSYCTIIEDEASGCMSGGHQIIKDSSLWSLCVHDLPGKCSTDIDTLCLTTRPLRQIALSTTSLVQSKF